MLTFVLKKFVEVIDEKNNNLNLQSLLDIMAELGMNSSLELNKLL